MSLSLATNGYYGGDGATASAYRMRAYDTTLGQYVYWTSLIIDSAATDYVGPGPLTDIVVQSAPEATS